MKGTLEKLRRIFISRKRQHEDVSQSKFARSLSFKKASMRRSLRRLTRRKAIVTSHGIVYVESEQAAAKAIGSGVADGCAGSAAAAAVGGGTLSSGSDVNGAPVSRERVVPDWSVARADATGTADRSCKGDAGSAGGSTPPRTAGDEPSSQQLAGAAGPSARQPSIPGQQPPAAAGPAQQRQSPTLVSSSAPGTAAAAPTELQARRASPSPTRTPSGARPAAAPPRLTSLADARQCMQSCDWPPSPPGDGGRCTSSEAEGGGGRRRDGRRGDDASPARAHPAQNVDGNPVGEPDGDRGRDSDGERHGDADSDRDGELPDQQDGGRAAGGGGRRRLPTVVATRDHLRRSLRRLSGGRHKRPAARRPESAAPAPAASGLDFYRLFTRVPPVTMGGAAAVSPSRPFTFSRRNPITQWLSEAEQQAERQARLAPDPAPDAPLWSELVLARPPDDAAGRRRAAKRAAKRCARVRPALRRAANKVKAVQRPEAGDVDQGGSAARADT